MIADPNDDARLGTPDLAESEGFRERFTREARIAADERLAAPFSPLQLQVKLRRPAGRRGHRR
jgi:hypothetical protein